METYPTFFRSRRTLQLWLVPLLLKAGPSAPPEWDDAVKSWADGRRSVRSYILEIEVDSTGTDPNIADTDGDGLLDGEEVRTYETNLLQVDSDKDGLADGAEIATEQIRTTLPRPFRPQVFYSGCCPTDVSRT